MITKTHLIIASTPDIEKVINKFIENKHVVDIKYAVYGDGNARPMHYALVIYKVYI